jgi:hypothetical protein
MTAEHLKLSYIKKVKPTLREFELMSAEINAHPLVEKAARAISDWRSESDWQIHMDKAIRTIEVIAEYLGREGHTDAKKYLQSVVWSEPKPRNEPAQERTARLFF